MSLMKIRKHQQQSPAGKEFRRPPSRGRALLLSVLALILVASAVWSVVDGSTAVAGLLLVGAVVSAALSYNHWRRLDS